MPDETQQATKPPIVRLAPHIEESIIHTLAAIREAARAFASAANEWRKAGERQGR
jgi:hypothetical protein